MDSRWKWVVILSLFTMVIWACTKTEEETPEQGSRESAPVVEKSAAEQTASMQQTDENKTDESGKNQSGSTEFDLGKGEEVYQQSCASCHTQGIAGAPTLTDTADWRQRLEKGMETLNDHAINGYQGETGMMPAKGGNPALSDYEVKAAVAYMIAEATN